MQDEITISQKKESSLIESLLSEGGRLVPEEEARRDFKRHMDNVGPIAEYYRNKSMLLIGKGYRHS